MKNSEDNIVLVNNTLKNNGTKEDGKDDEKGSVITMVHMSEKALGVKQNLPKGLVFKEKQK